MEENSRDGQQRSAHEQTSRSLLNEHWKRKQRDKFKMTLSVQREKDTRGNNDNLFVTSSESDCHRKNMKFSGCCCCRLLACSSIGPPMNRHYHVASSKIKKNIYSFEMPTRISARAALINHQQQQRYCDLKETTSRSSSLKRRVLFESQRRDIGKTKRFKLGSRHSIKSCKIRGKRRRTRRQIIDIENIYVKKQKKPQEKEGRTRSCHHDSYVTTTGASSDVFYGNLGKKTNAKTTGPKQVRSDLHARCDSNSASSIIRSDQFNDVDTQNEHTMIVRQFGNDNLTSNIINRRLIQSLCCNPSNSTRKQLQQALKQTSILSILIVSLILLVQYDCSRQMFANATSSGSQTAQSSSLNNQPGDPRPTIYSGQISFGLLLSAHSSMGAEMTGSASQQIETRFASKDLHNAKATTALPVGLNESSSLLISSSTSPSSFSSSTSESLWNPDGLAELYDLDDESSDDYRFPGTTSGRKKLSPESQVTGDHGDLDVASSERRIAKSERQLPLPPDTTSIKRKRRQIFQNNNRYSRQHQSTSSSSSSSNAVQHCTQVNPNALYAGMGAIWASHQANLVADSHFTIGTYVYDSCNDGDVGQRQSVRIVSNLNAFQQTTCESPRGSPISLTIAHGDDQVKAIHLLTSFRVPVISTKEHFAQDAYPELNGAQRKYLFSTAPSSRHLANGALRFARRVAAKSANSPKLNNRLYKSSSRQGLVVISNDLPRAFIGYLKDIVPSQINYELVATKLPIEQISSVQRLESIFLKKSFLSGSSTGSMSESRVHLRRIKQFSTENPPMTTTTIKPTNGNATTPNARLERRSSIDDYGSSLDGTESMSQDGAMLSPTILMFITPSEAIDLITRLRNNLAEVSKYFSLIIVTREDITPALKTIFQRGGSSLCSGKAFYTISPRPDEMSEFSRYFRDTVHIEGDLSDHPLICEYAKHNSNSRIAADYDDVAAEPVVKAVWAAAAAFKSVHKRECGSLVGTATSSSTGNVYKANPGAGSPSTSSSTTSSSTNEPQQAIRSLKSRQSSSAQTGSKSPHAECMMKMSKSMSQLVQKELKKINVHINSTGLQSLDGFQIIFDDLNELKSNKYSIRHINKECEIEEIGQYTGMKQSALSLDDMALIKSLESTLPDAWPVTTPAPPPEPTSSTSSTSSNTDNSNGDSSKISENSNNNSGSNDGSTDSGNSGGDNSTPSGGSSSSLGEQPAGSSNRPHKKKGFNRVNRGDGGQDEDSSTTPTEPEQEEGSVVEPSFHHRTSKRSRPNNGSVEQHQHHSTNQHRRFGIGSDRNPQSSRAAPTTLIDHTTSQIGMTDTTTVGSSSTNGKEYEDDRSAPTSKLAGLPPTITTSSGSPTSKPMRKLIPYQTTEGTNLKDWLPKEDQPAPTTTTRSNPNQPLGRKPSLTTPSPVSHHSTLPESGGNTDLEIPALMSSRTLKSSPKPLKPSNVPMAESTVTSESSEVVTMTSVSKKKLNQNQPNRNVTSSKIGANQTATGKLATASSTTMSSVTLKPFGRQGFSFDIGNQQQQHNQMDHIQEQHESMVTDDPMNRNNQQHDGQYQSTPFRDVDFSPVALSSEAPNLPSMSQPHSNLELGNPDGLSPEGGPNIRPSRPPISESQKLNRSKLSWFGLAILIANILGAILTLYVLTFLLMKNCDGSLDRENQSARSMHLLAIIVVFFGSTLFIVSPTPGLCLLRASWHNFALVLLFGCLLSQTMQARAARTLGLGGRPNRLNQFLTLVFLVGVQVSFELQRWKYESANYLNFVNQYFGSPGSDHKKLMILGNAIANQFNPLDSFNDLVTPVSIQVSEKYQSLLQDYCIQQTDDVLQSQIYLCIIVFLSILFSCLTRNHGQSSGRLFSGNGRSFSSRFFTTNRLPASRLSSGGNSMLVATMTSGKLVASEHEANLHISSSSSSHQPHSQFYGDHHHQPFGNDLNPNNIGNLSPTGGAGKAHKTGGYNNSASFDTGTVFIVSILNGFIYLCSILVHLYGYNSSNKDIISSVTMVLIAFVTLIGIFLPILHQIHRFDGRRLTMSAAGTLHSSRRRKLQLNGQLQQPNHHLQHHGRRSSSGSGGGVHNMSSAFTMFPEFSPTGLKKPTSLGSLSGESSSIAGGGSQSRKPFAETKESRRKMGFTLANLTIDPQLMQATTNRNHHQQQIFHDDQQLNGVNDDELLGMNLYDPEVHEILLDSNNHSQHQQQQQQHPTKPKRVPKATSSNGSNKHEKRLIMLDVDPCCPKHGVGARGGG